MANALFGSFLLWDCTITAAKKKQRRVRMQSNIGGATKH